MKTVYLLESERNPKRKYIGITRNFEERIMDHNAGGTPSTSRSTPWRCVLKLCFLDERKATAFENYLKSGSGHAFAQRHFW